jgi:hypothetical protein
MLTSFHPETPSPLRERAGVRGMKIDRLEIPGHYHPHPAPIKGEEKEEGFRMETN